MLQPELYPHPRVPEVCPRALRRRACWTRKVGTEVSIRHESISAAKRAIGGSAALPITQRLRAFPDGRVGCIAKGHEVWFEQISPLEQVETTSRPPADKVLSRGRPGTAIWTSPIDEWAPKIYPSLHQATKALGFKCNSTLYGYLNRRNLVVTPYKGLTGVEMKRRGLWVGLVPETGLPEIAEGFNPLVQPEQEDVRV